VCRVVVVVMGFLHISTASEIHVMNTYILVKRDWRHNAALLLQNSGDISWPTSVLQVPNGRSIQ